MRRNPILGLMMVLACIFILGILGLSVTSWKLKRRETL